MHTVQKVFVPSTRISHNWGSRSGGPMNSASAFCRRAARSGNPPRWSKLPEGSQHLYFFSSSPSCGNRTWGGRGTTTHLSNATCHKTLTILLQRGAQLPQKDLHRFFMPPSSSGMQERVSICPKSADTHSSGHPQTHTVDCQRRGGEVPLTKVT